MFPLMLIWICFPAFALEAVGFAFCTSFPHTMPLLTVHATAYTAVARPDLCMVQSGLAADNALVGAGLLACVSNASRVSGANALL